MQQLGPPLLMPGYRGSPVLKPGAWRKDAACATAGRSADQWFSEDWRAVKRAKAVCGTCPVQVECLATAFREEQA